MRGDVSARSGTGGGLPGAASCRCHIKRGQHLEGIVATAPFGEFFEEVSTERLKLLNDRWRGAGMGGPKMNRVGYQGTTALCAIVVVVVVMAFGAAMNSAASAEALEELCGACKVEVFVKGGKFLEGPAFDQAGN